MRKENKKGFTLTELIVVIVIIGILIAVLIPLLTSYINRSRKSSDTQLVRNLNQALSYDETTLKTGGKHQTMQDALNACADSGFIVAKINATARNNEILWDSVNDVFCYLNDEKVEYIPESNVSTKLNAGDYRLWKISNKVEGTEKYSIYYTGEETTITLNNIGFDAGESTTVTTLNYNGDQGNNVVIRTNSASTTLTIDDESTGSIYHYGAAGALNIIQCHTASYHENGKVGFAEIAKGRIVLEKGADVEEIHVNKKTDASFDTVIIANNGGADELPDRITRDAVTVSEETLVVKVESNGSSEDVYVYADGATGTKGSTQKITEGENKQNENVNSALGQLVLDNGATADKAQTVEEKADAKDAAASEAVSANFANQEGNNNYVARIGQTGFMSLQNAVEAANASENSVTISLLKDVQQSGSLVIRNSVSVNGENHIITTVGTATSGSMAAFDICDTEQKSPIIVNVKDLTINSTKHSRVFLLNADYCSYDNTNILNVNNLIITTDGQALYSNGPATINARNCEIKHEGQYLSGKDPVYYSAIIVGYNGTLNIYDSKVSSFGNGASTFPSGGTINIYNTEITAFNDFVDASTGYLFWARHEKSYDTGIYKDWCGSAIINVYSGVFEGPYRITHDGLTSANRIAAINIYGGTFEQNPSEYVQAGHSSQQNQDGTWTVK